ncbi:hypothetical protein CPB83DRAFT_374835 [Crepidotus variabilis]|uniref:F-box domain-containing protein n=1 Tax=Crepidotus variabilis TaxID=179855 RepID=A0A9P6JPI4_9AGAR|nr:hypothetical protein CPB83DRAFT_374835 [Crepidotus variabilis]
MRVSQVCQSWRFLLLEIPTVWGKLMDLDILCSRDRLREEVPSRSRNAPLWVRGHDHRWPNRSNAPIPNTFPIPFLKAYWPRIGRLNVSIQDLGTLWGVVTQAAPLLESFGTRVESSFCF